jgi:hypothetical protein
LEEASGDRIISRGLWTEPSPDLTTREFYLWGNLKNKIYRMKPHTEEELKENIRRELSEVPQKELRAYLGGTERAECTGTKLSARLK